MPIASRKPYLPIVLLFVIVTGLNLAFQEKLELWGADTDVLIIGNIILFAVTIFSYFLAQRGVSSTNTHGFLRGVYSSIMLKLFLSIAAAFIYIASTKEVNKPALFILMGLYLAYTFIEVSALTKQLQRKV